jgi:DNA-binding NtrC family response regulator
MPTTRKGAAAPPIRTWAEMMMATEQAERDWLRDALVRCEWSITRAAAAIEVSPSTLQSLIETRGLGPEYAQHARRPGRPRKDAEA